MYLLQNFLMGHYSSESSSAVFRELMNRRSCCDRLFNHLSQPGQMTSTYNGVQSHILPHAGDPMSYTVLAIYMSYTVLAIYKSYTVLAIYIAKYWLPFSTSHMLLNANSGGNHPARWCYTFLRKLTACSSLTSFVLCLESRPLPYSGRDITNQRTSRIGLSNVN